MSKSKAELVDDGGLSLRLSLLSDVSRRELHRSELASYQPPHAPARGGQLVGTPPAAPGPAAGWPAPTESAGDSEGGSSGQEAAAGRAAELATGDQLAMMAAMAVELEALRAGHALAHVPRTREEVQKAIFKELDVKKASALESPEVRRFAELTGFDGDDEDWRSEFQPLCASFGDKDLGRIFEGGFITMLDDKSDDGFHCTDKDLWKVYRQLVPESVEAEPIEQGPLPPADAQLALWAAPEPLPEESKDDDDDDSSVEKELQEEFSDAAKSEIGGPDSLEQIIGQAWEEAELPAAEDSEGEHEPAGPVSESDKDGEQETPRSSSHSVSDGGGEQTLDDLLVSAGVTTVPKRNAPAEPVHAGAKRLRTEPTSAPTPNGARCSARRSTAQLASPARAGEDPRRLQAVEPEGALVGGGRAKEDPHGRPRLAAEEPRSRALQALERDLMSLGTVEAMSDKSRIPTTATRAASVYMTAASTEEVLGVMAHLFRHGGLKQKHKLAILYVFHELLSQQVDLKARAKLALEGRSHLLEPIGPTVRALHKAGKGAALQRLLDIWGRAGYYPEGALEQLRHQWLPLTAQKTKTEQFS